MSALTQSSVWQALYKHYLCMKNAKMRHLFKADPHRFDKFSLRFNDILFDYSKNRITGETMGLLLDLARHADVAGEIEAMFTGQKINVTEKRAVLHVALAVGFEQFEELLTGAILPELTDYRRINSHDCSTNGLRL